MYGHLPFPFPCIEAQQAKDTFCAFERWLCITSRIFLKYNTYTYMASFTVCIAVKKLVVIFLVIVIDDFLFSNFGQMMEI